MFKHLLYFLFLFCILNTRAQIILNAYAKVTAIGGGATTFTVTNVNETNDNFTVGGKIIIMQMQDDVIGTNTTNIASFGNLGSIANAGNYEIGIISARSPAVGTPTSITLGSALVNGYSTSANSSLQIITLRDFGTNYTTTSNITGLAWDGNVGGVIAITTSNKIRLNHSINANFIGFKGGSRSNDFGGPICQPSNTHTYIVNDANYGVKGEGIYKSTNSTFNYARGKIASGGGGGSHHNAGGGGGGNYTAGGQGGNGFNNCTASPGGGLGGLSLMTYISTNRLFMGSGGGGGQQNNTVGSSGGAGGGIILLKTDTLIGGTTCSVSINITANGQIAANVGNDGGGGGGSGGTIVMQVNTYSFNAACPITLNSNGGDGGNVTNSSAHAGGGGGGQGAIIFSSVQPTLNVTSTTNNGLPGRDNSGGSISAIAGDGANNSGIIALSSSPLPIELLNFDGEKQDSKVKLFWNTATETNNEYFDVEKSTNAIEFKSIGTTNGAGNSNSLKSYFLYDTKPQNGINYYRLKQVDFDGKYKYSHIVSVDYDTYFDFSVYPNPLKQDGSLTIQLSKLYNTLFEINIYDAIGKLVYTSKTNTPNQSNILLNDVKLATGIYMVRLNNEFITNSVKLIVQ